MKYAVIYQRHEILLLDFPDTLEAIDSLIAQPSVASYAVYQLDQHAAAAVRNLFVSQQPNQQIARYIVANGQLLNRGER